MGSSAAAATCLGLRVETYFKLHRNSLRSVNEIDDRTINAQQIEPIECVHRMQYAIGGGTF